MKAYPLANIWHNQQEWIGIPPMICSIMLLVASLTCWSEYSEAKQQSTQFHSLLAAVAGDELQPPVAQDSAALIRELFGERKGLFQQRLEAAVEHAKWTRQDLSPTEVHMETLNAATSFLAALDADQRTFVIELVSAPETAQLEAIPKPPSILQYSLVPMGLWVLASAWPWFMASWWYGVRLGYTPWSMPDWSWLMVLWITLSLPGFLLVTISWIPVAIYHYWSSQWRWSGSPI